MFAKGEWNFKSEWNFKGEWNAQFSWGFDEGLVSIDGDWLEVIIH